MPIATRRTVINIISSPYSTYLLRKKKKKKNSSLTLVFSKFDQRIWCILNKVMQ